MGGRGTFSKGKIPIPSYYCVGSIAGVKVLSGIGSAHRLPEESNTSKAYIRLDHNGNFYQYREYNDEHKLVLEIGYHREPTLDKHAAKVLHLHQYETPGDFEHRTPRLLTKAEYEKYKKFFIGILQ